MKGKKICMERLYGVAASPIPKPVFSIAVRPPAGIPTQTQLQARCMISAAANEASVLTYCLRLGGQQQRSSLLQSTCDTALQLITADPETTDQATKQYWNAVLAVSQGLQDAVQAAAAVVGDSFFNQVCSAVELEEDVRRGREVLLAMYSSAEDLFWEMVIDDVNSIRGAAERAKCALG